MSVCLRPVIEKWGESYTYSIDHDAVVDLMREVAARADAGETWRHDYGDVTVVGPVLRCPFRRAAGAVRGEGGGQGQL